MKALLNLKPIKHDQDASGLRNLYDQIDSNCHSLNSLGRDSEGYGALLAPVIMEKLPPNVRLLIS